MLIDYTLGQTSIILRVKIRNSSVATGAGLTGLTNSSTGLNISTIADSESSATAYTAAGSTIDTITTLGTFGTITAGHCQFKQVDATNHPGLYEVQIANARFAVSNAKSLIVTITGATNAADCDVIIPLRSVNPYDATNGLAGAAVPTAPVANSWGEALLALDCIAGRFNTAQGGTSTTITLDAGASSDAGAYVGDDVYLYGGTGGGVRGTGQRRTIVAYNTSTKVATVHRAWDTTPDATTKFFTYPMAKGDAWMILGTAATAATAGILDVNAKNVGGTSQTGGDLYGYLTTNLGALGANATAIAGIVWNALTASYTTSNSFGKLVGAIVNQTGDAYAYLTTNLGALGANATSLASAVWSVATRVLTAGTNIVLAKGTGVTGFNDIAATAIVSNGAITTSGGKVSEVTLVDTLTTYTNNTPQTGDAFAYLGANLGALGANATAIGGIVWKDTTAGDFSVTGSIGNLLFTLQAGWVESILTVVDGLTFTEVGGVLCINASTMGWGDSGQAVALDGNGLPEVDVVDWKGSAAPANTGDAYAYAVANLGTAGAAATALAQSSIWTNALATNLGTTNTDVALSLQILQADSGFDTTTDPTQYHEVLYVAGTNTVLLTKKLTDITGAKLNSINTIIGGAKQ